MLYGVVVHGSSHIFSKSMPKVKSPGAKGEAETELPPPSTMAPHLPTSIPTLPTPYTVAPPHAKGPPLPSPLSSTPPRPSGGSPPPPRKKKRRHAAKAAQSRASKRRSSPPLDFGTQQVGIPTRPPKKLSKHLAPWLQPFFFVLVFSVQPLCPQVVPSLRRVFFLSLLLRAHIISCH